jgi:hypothetical protein
MLGDNERTFTPPWPVLKCLFRSRHLESASCNRLILIPEHAFDNDPVMCRAKRETMRPYCGIPRE